ncbi:hypothetical protein TcasGA2_TC000890 [Tribolium castaneum]|uniref:Uncharacterized protein n=1 Tax=Tribolium castaneum TaxID=7070 RepID=D6W908_TRICA|nr:hypothetical protein TcasGA2_TC000890 [Tribolium castaneum]
MANVYETAIASGVSAINDISKPIVLRRDKLIPELKVALRKLMQMNELEKFADRQPNINRNSSKIAARNEVTKACIFDQIDVEFCSQINESWRVYLANISIFTTLTLGSGRAQEVHFMAASDITEAITNSDAGAGSAILEMAWINNISECNKNDQNEGKILAETVRQQFELLIAAGAQGIMILVIKFSAKLASLIYSEFLNYYRAYFTFIKATTCKLTRTEGVLNE